jgi:cytochrome c-type biogenesis protein CcmH
MQERPARSVAYLFVALLLAATAVGAAAKEAVPEAADPALEARMTRITSELRCLVCQNQTIADSSADLAADLRRQTRELLKQGKSDQEIVAYMTARYGDFVLYRPPLRATTALLWFGPGLMLIGGAAVLVLVLRRRSRMASDAFEADDGEDDDRVAASPAQGA